MKNATCTAAPICFGASAGGHMNQLLRLLDNCQDFPGMDRAIFVTTMDEVAGKLSERGQVYVIGECNRHHPLDAMRVLFRSIKIAYRHRPKIIITTGSLPLAILSIVCKPFGSKVIWIDSIANIENFSVSGRLMRHFADLFLTQWPELASKYNNVEYAGAIV